VLALWCTAILACAFAKGANAAHDCAKQTEDQFLSARAAQQARDAGRGSVSQRCSVSFLWVRVPVADLVHE
jgi:hypothetical protein